MKKLALMTAVLTASAVAVPTMADNGYRHNNHDDHRNASNHKYVKYNNGNAYGKYKNKHNVKSKKYTSHYYTTKHPVAYRHTATNAYKKWPVPSKPSDKPAVRYVIHR